MLYEHCDCNGNFAPPNLREEYEVADINTEFNDIESPTNMDLYEEGVPVYIPEPDPRTIYPMEVGTLNKLFHAAEYGGTVALSDDVILTAPLKIKGNMVLDLNGHSIKNTEDIWDEKNGDWSLLSVRGGSLEVTGQGTLQAKENDCYAIDVKDNGHCVINSGKFVGNIHAVYVHKGDLIIRDGEFSVQQKSAVGKPEGYVINCLDKNYVDGVATVSIQGGTYKGFDPSSAPELKDTDKYLEEGYKVVESNGYFTVNEEV